VVVVVSKTAAMVLTIIGGVFYIMGGFIAGAIVWAALGSLSVLLGSPNPTEVATSALMTSIEVGLFSGIIIIIGGVLIHARSRKVRVIGGVLAIVGMLVGIINTFGGLLIGLILTLLGSIFGFLYKEPEPPATQASATVSSSPG
jgi:hypothetical protein